MWMYAHNCNRVILWCCRSNSTLCFGCGSWIRSRHRRYDGGVPIHGEREVSYIYEHTSHSFNLKSLKQYAARRLLVLVDLTLALALRDPESICSRSLQTNLQQTYRRPNFVCWINGWEGRSCTRIPSLHIPQAEWRWKWKWKWESTNNASLSMLASHVTV